MFRLTASSSIPTSRPLLVKGKIIENPEDTKSHLLSVYTMYHQELYRAPISVAINESSIHLKESYYLAPTQVDFIKQQWFLHRRLITTIKMSRPYHRLTYCNQIPGECIHYNKCLEAAASVAIDSRSRDFKMYVGSHGNCYKAPVERAYSLPSQITYEPSVYGARRSKHQPAE